MAYIIQTMKTHGIWILIICTFATSSFYVVLEMGVVKYSKPSASTVMIGNNQYVVDGPVRKIKENATHNTDALGIKETFDFDEIHHNMTDRLSQQNSSVMSTDTIKDMEQNAFNFEVSAASNDSVHLNLSAIKIGILIPSSTKNITSPLLEQLSLIKICLPTIYNTMEDKYKYVIYVGIDKGDYLETVKDKLEKMFDKVKTVVVRSRTFTQTVNAIAREAYQDDMEYLVRINDDTSIETQNWTSKGISSLLRYSPPNIGVVGPTCHDGNTAILTHDMVHRTHLEIFDFYYPPYFDNWWADDWITEVYKPQRSTKLSTWIVKHHFKTHGRRYDVDFKKEARLSKTLTFDKERLSEYISNLNQL